MPWRRLLRPLRLRRCVDRRIVDAWSFSARATPFARASIRRARRSARAHRRDGSVRAEARPQPAVRRHLAAAREAQPCSVPPDIQNRSIIRSGINEKRVPACPFRRTHRHDRLRLDRQGTLPLLERHISCCGANPGWCPGWSSRCSSTSPETSKLTSSSRGRASNGRA
jgi:hypothetical protein